MVLVRLVVCALLLLLLPAPATEEKELFGRPLPALLGRPAVVVYANQATQKEKLTEHLTDLSFRLRDVRPVVLVRVDLRGLPKLFTGFALSTMRSQYFKGIRRYAALCRASHLAAPSLAEAEASFFMSYDPAGAPHRALGLPSGFRSALAIAYDAQGREIARVRFPEEADVLERAVRASAGTTKSPSTGSGGTSTPSE
jgi:hypothetical protein